MENARMNHEKYCAIRSAAASRADKSWPEYAYYLFLHFRFLSILHGAEYFYSLIHVRLSL